MLQDLSLGERWTLVGGKGGVGKTTIAAALAIQLARGGRHVLALSLDPAHSLGDALGVTLGSEPVSISEVPGLVALELDPLHERDRFLGAHREVLERLLERGTLLEGEDIHGLLDLAAPGIDELAALLRLLELARDEELYVVVDTPPTGHTLRLFALVRTVRRWIEQLGSMQAEHEAVVRQLSGAAVEDGASDFLRTTRSELEQLASLLTDTQRTRFLLVTTAEPVVIAETRRYADALRSEAISLGGVVLNRASSISTVVGGEPNALVPEVRPPPVGVSALHDLLDGATAAPSPPAQGTPPLPSVAYLPPMDRRIYWVVGKGGVGKTTISSALAVQLADAAGKRVLLVSTDPAGSLGDVFSVDLPREGIAVEGLPSLELRQTDAEAAWESFRARFRSGAETRAMSGISSRAEPSGIVRLLDAAPPGIDEIVALLELDAVDTSEYDAVVVDPAPTGHLLRLLEMPEVALQWIHTILRLQLKYREVLGLGRAAEELLGLARTLRILGDRLRDPRHSAFLVALRPEPLSVLESERLLSRLESLGIRVEAVVANRAEWAEWASTEEPWHRLARLSGARPLVVAPECPEGPRGVEALRSFFTHWRATAPDRTS